MPCPPIKYGLVVPSGRKGRAILHAVECSCLPPRHHVRGSGLRDIVWSTTYNEIDDYASQQFGEDGWTPCPSCHAINEGDTR